MKSIFYTFPYKSTKQIATNGGYFVKDFIDIEF